MGLRGWIAKQNDGFAENQHYFNIGCEVLGPPQGGAMGMGTPLERAERVAAGRKEEARRAALGQQAADAALGAAYREAKAQRGRDTQFESHGIKVRVKNGYSRRFDRYTTDIVLIDPRRPSEHLHLVLDDNGNEIHNQWTKNH